MRLISSLALLTFGFVACTLDSSSPAPAPIPVAPTYTAPVAGANPQTDPGAVAPAGAAPTAAGPAGAPVAAAPAAAALPLLSANASVFQASCNGCHSGTLPLSAYPKSEIADSINSNPARMPQGSTLSAANKTAILNYLATVRDAPTVRAAQ